MRDQQQNAKSAAIPSDPVRAREVRRRRLHAARTKAIDHTRLISRQPTRRRAPTAPRRPGFNRIRSDCRRVQTHYHRPAVDVEYPFPLSRTARPAVSPSINIASGRLSKALFDMSFAMINMCTGCSDRRARSDSVNQYFAPDNELNASQAVWRDHGHVNGSKGRKRSLLPSKMAFLPTPA